MMTFTAYYSEKALTTALSVTKYSEYWNGILHDFHSFTNEQDLPLLQEVPQNQTESYLQIWTMVYFEPSDSCAVFA